MFIHCFGHIFPSGLNFLHEKYLYVLWCFSYLSISFKTACWSWLWSLGYCFFTHMFGLRQGSLLCETWISVNFCHGFEPSCYVINKYMHPVNSLNLLVVIRNSHPYESICYPRVLEMCLGVCASPSCCDHSGAHMGILDASAGYCITWDFCIPPKKNKDCQTDTTHFHICANLSIFRSP